VRDSGHADVGIGQHRLGGLDVVVRQFRRTASGAANAPRGGEARLGTLPNQAGVLPKEQIGGRACDLRRSNGAVACRVFRVFQVFASLGG
jgi:hypothetical protein